MNFSAWSRLVGVVAFLGAVGCGGGSGGGVGTGGAGGEAGDTSGPAAFTITDVELKEGDVGTRKMTFTVSLPHALDEVARVAYVTEDDTAVSTGVSAVGGLDYEPTSATLRFEPGETSQTFDVTINGDRKPEDDEVFRVKLSKPTGASIEKVYGHGTIQNDDHIVPEVSIGDAQVNEGNSGASEATLEVTLSEASDAEVSVDFSVTGGNATDGDDYTAVDGTVTFAPGETTQTITLEVAGDTMPESNETVVVSLSRPQGATLGTPDGTLTIVNDDIAGPKLSISDASTSEGSFGSKQLSFTITLSPAAAIPVTIDYATVDSSATSNGSSSTGGFDFAATSDSLTFAPGETQKNVSVTVYGDALAEPDETFTVELYNGAGAVVIDPVGTGTILNDDALPKVTISDASVSEGAAGARTASFLVSLSPASGQPVSVNYATSDSSATAGEDYAAASGKLTFAAGQSSAYVSVLVDGDLLDEDDEQFVVSLSNATNASFSDSQAIGTILNDDGLPTLSINDVAIVEGDSGSKNAVFDVTLSAASGRDVSVSWMTAAGSATSNQDYAAASGVLDFPAGTTMRSVSVAIYGDALDESNETFTVDLSAPLHATLADDQGLGTIVTDDSSLPGITIGDASISEGNAGTATLSFNVTLSASSAQTVKVNYQTMDDMAVSTSDYVATSGTLTFTPGQTTKQIDVTVNGDTLNELDESVFVVLSNPVSAYIAVGLGTGIISNDDTEPSLSIDDVSITEGNAGKKNATFTISLSAASGIAVNVTYATADGSAVEAGLSSAGQDDYDAASAVAVIPVGQTSVKITVPINGDAITEGDETFQVLLSFPQNAAIADGSGQCTITNDDALPTIKISDVSVTEGDAGTKAFTFTLTLSAASGATVSVDYATADGTALKGFDYNQTSGTVMFAPGQTTATLDVLVIGETAVEGHKNETFFVNLTNPQGATLSDAQGTGTILDDD